MTPGSFRISAIQRPSSSRSNSTAREDKRSLFCLLFFIIAPSYHTGPGEATVRTIVHSAKIFSGSLSQRHKPAAFSVPFQTLYTARFRLYTSIMKLEAYIRQKNEGSEPLPDDPKKSLSEILNRPFTAEKIDTYFDHALNDLVTLTERAVHAYSHIHPRPRSSSMRKEDLAFSYFGLQGIPEILSSIAKKQDELKLVEDWLSVHSEIFRDVIVPPGSIETNIGPGTRPTESQMFYNRIKTLLYVLKDEGADLSGLRATRGHIRDEMMRRTSYISFEIPEINRLALVCDEKGNASYIFDLEKLLDVLEQKEKLFHMEKEKINEMIRQNEGLGVRYTHSRHWADRTRNFLFGTLELKKAASSESAAYPVSQDELDPWRGFWTNPDGKHHGPKKQIARKIGVGENSVQAAIEKLGLTSTFKLRTQNNDWPGYPYEDIADEFRNMLALPQVAKEGRWRGYREIDGIHYGTKTTIMKALDVPKKKVEDAILQKSIVAIPMRDRANLEADGYPFETIRAALEEYLRLPKATSFGEWKDFASKNGEHIGTIHAISAKLGVSFPTVTKRVEDNKLEPVKIRGVREETTGYSFERVRDLIAEQRDIPEVQREGIWRGFFEKEGKHFGPITTIASRLNANEIKANKNIVKRLATGNKLQSENLLDLDRKPNTGYAYEDILPLAKKFYDLPQVAKDGPQKGFFEQNGKLYGSLIWIADKLEINYSTLFERFQRWQKDGTAPQFVEGRDLGGSKTNAFALSDIEERVKDLVEKNRRKP